MNTKKRIVIFTNGDLSKEYLKYIAPSDYFIGVDRAAFWLLQQKITPHVAIGDFDSVSKSQYKKIRSAIKIVKAYAQNKDYTDTELALQYAIKQKPSEIIIYGGLGNRLDHTLATIQLLEMVNSFKIPVVIYDINNEIRLISGTVNIKKGKEYHYTSLLPITDYIIITLKGFLYDINKAKIVRGQTLGISNEMVASEAIITLHEGKALVIRSRDR